MAGLIQKSARRFTTQIGAAGVADAAVTTIPLVSVTGLPTDTVIELIIDRSDSSGVLTPSKEEVVRGTISGTNLINCTRGVEGTAQAHSAGATVNALLTASMWNNMSQYIRDMPSRGLIGGIIQPTVAGNNLTVAVKTLTGNDPSVNEPVYVWIGNTLRSITSALSVTANAGTNWFNYGSSQLATYSCKYYAYVGFNAIDGITFGFSPIHWGRLYSDFSTTQTNDTFCRISTITNATAGDNYINVGSFYATNSGTASFNWSVPTFTTSNLIQEPDYVAPWLNYTPTYSTGGAGTYTSVTTAQAKFRRISAQELGLIIFARGTTNSLDKVRATIPITYNLNGGTGSYPFQFLRFAVMYSDGGAETPGIAQISNGTGNTIEWRNAWTVGASRDIGFNGILPLT